jgi:hypothetical protein
MTNVDQSQSTSANSALWIELDDEKAQTINGGSEIFTISNEVSNYTMSYKLDGTSDELETGYSQEWTAYSGGTITFDKDGRSGYQKSKEYDLEDGRIYAFRPNTSTRNVYDFQIYDIT